jgi:hypothetical protein
MRPVETSPIVTDKRWGKLSDPAMSARVPVSPLIMGQPAYRISPCIESPCTGGSTWYGSAHVSGQDPVNRGPV